MTKRDRIRADDYTHRYVNCACPKTYPEWSKDIPVGVPCKILRRWSVRTDVEVALIETITKDCIIVSCFCLRKLDRTMNHWVYPHDNMESERKRVPLLSRQAEVTEERITATRKARTKALLKKGDDLWGRTKGRDGDGPIIERYKDLINKYVRKARGLWRAYFLISGWDKDIEQEMKLCVLESYRDSQGNINLELLENRMKTLFWNSYRSEMHRGITETEELITKSTDQKEAPLFIDDIDYRSLLEGLGEAQGWRITPLGKSHEIDGVSGEREELPPFIASDSLAHPRWDGSSWVASPERALKLLREYLMERTTSDLFVLMDTHPEYFELTDWQIIFEIAERTGDEILLKRLPGIKNYWELLQRRKKIGAKVKKIQQEKLDDWRKADNGNED